MRIHNLVLVIAIPAMALAQSDRVRPAPPPVKVVPLEKIVDTKPMTPATGGVVVVTGAGCVLSVVAVPTDGPPVAGQITSTGPLRGSWGLTDQPIENTVGATTGARGVRSVPPSGPAAQ